MLQTNRVESGEVRMSRVGQTWAGVDGHFRLFDWIELSDQCSEDVCQHTLALHMHLQVTGHYNMQRQLRFISALEKRLFGNFSIV